MINDANHVFLKGSLEFGKRFEDFLEIKKAFEGCTFNIIKLVPSGFIDQLNYGLNEDIKMIKNILDLNSFVYIREYDQHHLVEKKLNKTQFKELLTTSNKFNQNLILKWYIQDAEDYYLKLAIPELQDTISCDENELKILKNLFIYQKNEENLITVNEKLRFEVFCVNRNSIESRNGDFIEIIRLFFMKNKSKNIETEKTEIKNQWEFCNLKVKNFIGRSNTVKNLIEIFKKTSNKPLIIHGRSGCGKSGL
jgi:transcriptional regulator with GAF, ATPase, and Fis domain